MKNKLINFSKNIFKGIKTGLKELLIILLIITFLIIALINKIGTTKLWNWLNQKAFK